MFIEIRGGRCRGDTFFFNLRISTNNQAKTYVMLQGLRLALDCHITSIIVVGDSNVLIQSMHKTSHPTDHKIASKLARISQEVSRFYKINFFQILRENNTEADSLVNE
jgi:ribonuclease HI